MEGEDKPLYPDFLFFRNENGKIAVDLLDPHDSGLADAVEKAKGRAEYAKKHGDQFGRIELIVENSKGELKRLNLNKESIRDEVFKVTSKPHLDKFLEDLG